MRKSIDKRILQTEAALKEALLSLLSEKKISEITVGDLTGAAAINRSTFYLHYRDVSDFFEKWMDALAEALSLRMQKEQPEGAFPWEARFILLLSHMKEESKTFAPLLAPHAGGALAQRLVSLLEEPVRSFAEKAREASSPAVSHAYGTMLLHGLVAVAAEWLAEGAQTPPEELAELLGTLSGNETILKKFRELG